MSAFTLDHLKQAMLDAGLEIYRVNGSEIRLAERVRVHLMDSGVSISIRDKPQICVTVRGQRSDFPSATTDDLFSKVRVAMQGAAVARGFQEIGATARDITDPVDDANVLDVWHELTFAKDIDALDALLEDVRWALSLRKCIEP